MPNDWFDLNITVQVDGQTVPLSDVIVELASGATHMLLPTGVYFRLDTPELLRLRELLEEARALGEIEGDSVNARTLNVTLWDELLALGVVDEQVANWHQTLKRLTSGAPTGSSRPARWSGCHTPRISARRSELAVVLVGQRTWWRACRRHGSG